MPGFSTITENFIKDGTFGRRIIAMIASFYTIALLYGRYSTATSSDTGYSVIAGTLRAIGLHSAAEWLTGTLIDVLMNSPVLDVTATVVITAAVISLTATFRRNVYDISPQAAFAYLLSATLLVDLEKIPVTTAVVGMVVIAVLAGLFCALPSDDTTTGPMTAGLLMLCAPLAAILYGPLKILDWLATEPRRPQVVPVTLEHGTGPVKIEVIESTSPTWAETVPRGALR